MHGSAFLLGEALGYSSWDCLKARFIRSCKFYLARLQCNYVGTICTLHTHLHLHHRYSWGWSLHPSVLTRNAALGRVETNGGQKTHFYVIAAADGRGAQRSAAQVYNHSCCGWLTTLAPAVFDRLSAEQPATQPAPPPPNHIGHTQNYSPAHRPNYPFPGAAEPAVRRTADTGDSPPAKAVLLDRHDRRR